MKRSPIAALVPVVVVTLVFLLAPVGPAQAADVAAGGAVFSGRSELPVVPCHAPEPGSLPCQGTWQGSFTGAFNGTKVLPDGGRIPWTVEVDAPGKAHFVYTDVVEQGTCVGSIARGRLDLAGGLNQAFGAYGNAFLVPAPVIGIRASIDFEWRRDGTAGVLVASTFFMELEVYGVGRVTVVDDEHSVSAADAVASFVPDAPLDCTGEPGPVTGAVEGKLSGISISAS